MEIVNRSNILAQPVAAIDRFGRETLLVIAKGSWRIHSDGTLSLAELQSPIHLQPAYRGDPQISSLLHDTDLAPEKPGTDCILIGQARAPRGRVGSLDVSFAVGPVDRTVRVFGDRSWLNGLWSSRSQPEPFESLPLVWENSFGGSDASPEAPRHHEVCLENPVGRGLLARRTKRKVNGSSLPNIEDPARLMRRPQDRPRPVGFAPIPAQWHPRARHAGTYNRSWRDNRHPLPPEDLDPRFYCSAAPGLTTAGHLLGNEPVRVENACRYGRLNFLLPGMRPEVTVRVGQAQERLPVALDTVVVEPDEERLVLVWRGRCEVQGRLHQVDRISVGLQRL